MTAHIHPDVGPVKLGRTPAKPNARRVRFGTFVKAASLDVPPAATAYSPVAQPCLDQMMLNNRLSTCTSATSFHIAGLLLGNAGVAIKFSNDQVEAFYSLSTGYQPGHPETDDGGNEIDVLNYWRAHGLEKKLHGIAGHLSIDGSNRTQVETALWRFENLFFGVSLPDSWLTARNGATLDASHPPNPNNGHAFAGVKYDEVGVWVVLWGGVTVRLTWAAVARYTASAAGGELHAVVSRDAIRKGSQLAYSGIDYAGIVKVFEGMGGAAIV